MGENEFYCKNKKRTTFLRVVRFILAIYRSVLCIFCNNLTLWDF